MPISHRSLAVPMLAAIITAFAPSAFAQAVYTGGHGDIGIAYEDGAFHPHWHLGGGAIVDGSPLDQDVAYSAGMLVARTQATFAAPSGSSTWLGVAEGSTVYRMGNNTFQPNLGWGMEEVGVETDWVGETITIQLTGSGASNPGDFALVGSGGAIFSTMVGSSDTWVFDVATGHAHASWYFSQPGFYELTFSWNGQHLTDGLVTGSGTFGFQVGAIPEPSSAAALAGLAGLGLVTLRRKPRA